MKFRAHTPRAGDLAGLESSPAARFENIYDSFHNDVLRFTMRRLGANATWAQAEDITHEVFITAWRRLNIVPYDNDAAKAWLYEVARNKILHAKRSYARRAALSVKISETVTEVVPSPESLVNNGLDLSRAWAKLMPIEQEAISLVAFEQLDNTQAAKVLGISVTAYRTRLSRARMALKKAIASNAAPETGTSTQVTNPPSSRKNLRETHQFERRTIRNHIGIEPVLVQTSA